MAMTQLLRGANGNGYRVHGFRSTFRDWAGDHTNFDRETIEHALAHKLPDKVEALTGVPPRSRSAGASWTLGRTIATPCIAADGAAVIPIGKRA